MADIRAVRGKNAKKEAGNLFTLERDAHEVVDLLPELSLEANRIASTISHGIHGRRRSGPGETFWQFRQLEAQDSIQLIDWRRSASSDHLYVGEREWEAAHTVWLWPDLSPSMEFRSHLSKVVKRDRALVIALAAAELLVRSGERVALLGLTQPTSSHKATTRIVQALAANAHAHALTKSEPPKARLARFTSVILVSDFLDPPSRIREYVESMAAQGVTGHLVQVLDPAEETLPYEGRIEFLGVEGDESWTADRAESLRDEYQSRLRAHRAELVEMTGRIGWSFIVHHTDRPAAEVMLALIMHLKGGQAVSPYAMQAPALAGGQEA
jgi:uncharacterized protein (DUF58 family)